MLQVSSFTSNYRQSYGSRHSSVTKAVNTVTPKVTPNVKKAVGLGAILAALFGIKKVDKTPQPVQNEPKPNKFQYREEKVYDENGKLTHILKYSNADDVLSIRTSFDKDGNKKQQDWFKKDGFTEQYTETYNPDGTKKYAFWYSKNGKGCDWIETYGKDQQVAKEITYFDKDGNMSSQVEIDDGTRNVKNRFIYKGSNLGCREEVASLTGRPTRKTFYNDDGSKTVEEYNILTNEKEAIYDYDKNNNLIDMKHFDNSNAQRKAFFNLKIYNEKQNLYDEPTKRYSKQDINSISDFLKSRYEMEHAE